jgi:hypothetical protein
VILGKSTRHALEALALKRAHGAPEDDSQY